MSGILGKGRHVNKIAERVSQRDFLLEGVGTNSDEAAARFMDAVRQMGGDLDSMLHHATSSITGATKIDADISKVKLSIMKQVMQMEGIAISMEEMSQTIIDISKSASTASESAKKAKEVAEEGKRMMDDTVTHVNSVMGATSDLQGAIGDLDTRIKEVGEVIGFIKDVADQTNLLALNAAIEAARAGDQGRGFAVVADEVRKLAERTMKATREIEDTLNRIKGESVRTTSTMDASMTEVQAAKTRIEGLKGTLDIVVESVEKSSDDVTRIATAVEEQSSATEEVARSVEDVLGLFKSVEDEMEGLTSTAADGVLENASRVSEILSGFSFAVSTPTMLERVKADHRVWVKRLYRMYHGLERISHVGDHRACRLGTWYYSDAPGALSKSRAFRELEEPHKLLHEKAQQCVELYNRGDRENCLKAIMQVEDVSNRVVGLIEELKGA
jgi:methyl-accepting chemotaxis protein